MSQSISLLRESKADIFQSVQRLLIFNLEVESILPYQTLRMSPLLLEVGSNDTTTTSHYRAWVASNTEGSYKRSAVLGLVIGW